MLRRRGVDEIVMMKYANKETVGDWEAQRFQAHLGLVPKLDGNVGFVVSRRATGCPVQRWATTMGRYERIELGQAR